jgi:hypothetical protein
MDWNIGIDPEAQFHVCAMNPGSVVKNRIRAPLFLSSQCPVDASAIVFTARLKIFSVRAYPITVFTVSASTTFHRAET